MGFKLLGKGSQVKKICETIALELPFAPCSEDMVVREVLVLTVVKGW